MKRLSAAFASSLGVRLVQMGLAIVLARALGQGGYGVYVFASGVGAIGARFAALGWPPLMLRLIPELRVQNQCAALAGLLRRSWHVVGAAGLGLGLGLVSLARLAPAELQLGLMVGAGLVPFWAMRALGRAHLNALGHPARGIWLDGGVVAFAMLAGLLVWQAVAPGLAPEGVLSGLLFASGGAVVLAWRWSRAVWPAAVLTAPPAAQTRLWMAMALPMLAGMAARLAMERADILMLAPLADLEAVGLYGAAARLCVVQTFAASTLNVVLSPAISAARARGDPAASLRLLGLGLGAVGMVAGLGAGIFWLWGAPIMAAVFGQGFAQAGPVLGMLGLAQVAGALSILLSGHVIVCGHQGSFAKLSVAALILNLLANLVLIPTHGALGAAGASALALTALTLGLAGLSWRIECTNMPQRSAIA